MGVSVGGAGAKVAEGVSVGGTGVSVGLAVGVWEGVVGGVSVGVSIGVAVGIGTDVSVGAGFGVSDGNGGRAVDVSVDVSCEATGIEVFAAADREPGGTEPGVTAPISQLTSNIAANVRKTTWGRCVLEIIPFPRDA